VALHKKQNLRIRAAALYFPHKFCAGKGALTCKDREYGGCGAGRVLKSSKSA